MSLRSFHVLFIALSSLLALAFGAWCLSPGGGARGGVHPGFGIAAFVAAAALVAYGVWFWGKVRNPDAERRRARTRFRTLPAVALPLWFGARDALACSVCYGEAEGSMIDAARLGVWLLFGLVLALQGAFASFFVVLWRRSRSRRPGGRAATEGI